MPLRSMPLTLPDHPAPLCQEEIFVQHKMHAGFPHGRVHARGPQVWVKSPRARARAAFAHRSSSAPANLHAAHNGAALFRNAINPPAVVRPPLGAVDPRLRACAGLVNPGNRELMQTLWTALDTDRDGKLTVRDYVMR